LCLTGVSMRDNSTEMNPCDVILET
jgi:hypothetical protein